jgi:DNA repair exonuclease SbcCD ATPase subunit
MRIERLEINGFGKIRDLVLTPGSGLNVIYGANEAGKSTVQRFIRAMFYGLRSGRDTSGIPAAQKRYMPWDGAPYGGVMIYSLDDGSVFRAERNFEKNTVRIFDANYNDISGTFRLGRDKLPMFADEHLGIDEATFVRTAFIAQTDVRVSGSGSSELAARLANVRETGVEAMSFQRAEAALTNALKNRIGTGRTRIQPLDKLEARRKQLREEHAMLRRRQEQRQSLKEELADVKERLAGLEAREQYLAKVGELVEARKKIDAGIKKEAGLRDTAALLEDTERKLSELAGTERTANGYAGLNGDAGRRSGEDAGATRSRRDHGRAGHPVFGRAAVILCFAAAIISGTLFVPAAAAVGYTGLPMSSLIYAVIMVISVLAGIFSFIRVIRGIYGRTKGLSDGLPGEYHENDSDTGAAAGPAGTGAVWTKTGIYVLKERKESIELIKRNALNSASLLCGRRTDSAEDVRSALNDIRSELEELSAGLQKGIEEAEKMEPYGAGCFMGRDLDMAIYDTDISSLESALAAERKSVSDELLKTALREKYCEGMAEDDREISYELQRVEEETVAVEEKIAYLKNKAEAIRLAHDVLCEAAAQIRRDFTPALNSRMSAAVSGMTGQRYTDLRGDDALVLRAVTPDRGEVRNVLLLSGGTADQMYLAMRLSMTDLLTSGSESLPLIMDEVFSQFDDNRTALALKYLHDEYRDGQIFLFTCKKREAELAEQIFGDRMNFVELGYGDS